MHMAVWVFLKLQWSKLISYSKKRSSSASFFCNIYRLICILLFDCRLVGFANIDKVIKDIV